ncbi:unnamed protein product [Spodoptera exigua]|nr:unnamed protein product [Spodoptera exigua]
MEDRIPILIEDFISQIEGRLSINIESNGRSVNVAYWDPPYPWWRERSIDDFPLTKKTLLIQDSVSRQSADARKIHIKASLIGVKIILFPRFDSFISERRSTIWQLYRSRNKKTGIVD